MTDKKISELDAITGSNTAATDVFVVVDTSTGQTKKITREELNNAIEQDVLSSIDIDTINGDFSVTGTVTADGLIVGIGDYLILDGGSAGEVVRTPIAGTVTIESRGSVDIYGDSNNNGAPTSAVFRVLRDSTYEGGTAKTTLNITDNGDISFYEDTGTTAKLTWDASAESLNFADNGKAIFGAGSDLQIYHDGSNSAIQNATGELFIYGGGDQIRIRAENSEEGIVINPNGSVNLYHNGSSKLATNSAGVQTNVLSANGLKVGGNGTDIDSTVSGANSVMSFRINGSEKMRLDSSGRLGLGTTSPDGKLHIDGASDTVTGLVFEAGVTGDNKFIDFQNTSGAKRMGVEYDNNNVRLSIVDRNENKLLTIKEGDGNVGIGTSSPSATLHVAGGNSNQFIIGQNTLVSGGSSRLQLVNTSDTSGTAGTAQGFQIINNGNDGIVNILNYKSTPMAFWTSGSERARLDASGNLLVGTTNASNVSDGVRLKPDGFISAANTSGPVLYANRLSTDGSILEFQKDGTTVGSIGVNNANNTFIGSTTTSHTGFEFGNDILPRKNSNTADNQTNLGNSSIRFANLHLGGTAYASGAVIEGSSDIGNTEATLQVRSTETMAAGTGGTISLMGDDGTGTQRTFGMIKGAKGNASSGAFGGGLEFYSRTNGVGDAVKRMVIDQQGLVGIGESNPATRLEIKDATPILRLTDSFNGAQVAGHDIAGISFFSDDASGIGAHETGFIFNESEIGGTSLSGALVFGTAAYNTAAVERMRVNGSGMVLIGRTTSTLGGGNGSDLQIGSGTSSAGLTIHTSTSGLGDIQFADGTTGADSYRGLLRYNHSSNHMSIYTNGTEAARLESDADLHVNGNVVAYSTTISDIRLKKDIAPIEDAVTKVQQLNGCTFTYLKDDRKSAGLIAQDVEKVLPSAVIEDEAVFHGEEGETYKTVQYDQLIGLLVEAVKELKAEIEELKNGTAK